VVHDCTELHATRARVAHRTHEGEKVATDEAGQAVCPQEEREKKEREREGENC
jgi:hypothetical protein